MLERLKVVLTDLYITEPLEPETFKKSLDSDLEVVHQLYILKNGHKSIQKFAKLKNPDYDLISHIRTEYGYVGKAKKQVWSVTRFASLLKRKPKYTFTCVLQNYKTNTYDYYNKVESLNPEVIYKIIEETYQDLQIILNSFD